jgi:curved DNA-binding protein CbpA
MLCRRLPATLGFGVSWVLTSSTFVNVRHQSLHAALRAPRGSHYAKLGVPVTATEAELKSAYRKRALECHPDVVAPGDKSSAEAEFRRISEAYSVLGDPRQRPLYDRSIGVAIVEHPDTAGRPVATATPRKQTPTQARRPSSPLRSTSPGARAQSPGRPPSPGRGRWTLGGRPGGMVRGEADAVFRAAFQGKTIHDVVFAARYAKKYGRDKPAAAGAAPGRRGDGLAKSGSDLGRESADEAIQTTAEDIARLYETKYKFVDPKLVRIHLTTNAGEPAEPPSSYMPFRPFHGVPPPPGVIAMPDPQAEAPVQLKASEDFRIEVDEREWRDLALPAGYAQDASESAVFAKRDRKAHHEPHNLGMLRSHRRPV